MNSRGKVKVSNSRFIGDLVQVKVVTAYQKSLLMPQNTVIQLRYRRGMYYTNHIKYLISSEPHRHLNPRRIDAEMVIPF